MMAVMMTVTMMMKVMVTTMMVFEEINVALRIMHKQEY